MKLSARLRTAAIETDPSFQQLVVLFKARSPEVDEARRALWEKYAPESWHDNCPHRNLRSKGPWPNGMTPSQLKWALTNPRIVEATLGIAQESEKRAAAWLQAGFPMKWVKVKPGSPVRAAWTNTLVWKNFWNLPSVFIDDDPLLLANQSEASSRGEILDEEDFEGMLLGTVPQRAVRPLTREIVGFLNEANNLADILFEGPPDQKAPRSLADFSRTLRRYCAGIGRLTEVIQRVQRTARSEKVQRAFRPWLFKMEGLPNPYDPLLAFAKETGVAVVGYSRGEAVVGYPGAKTE